MENEQKNSQFEDHDITIKHDDKTLEKYVDLSGISISNLNFGLWWMQNSKNVKQITFFALIAFGGLCWLYTLGNFGYYWAVGMNKDNQMLSEMTQKSVSLHEYVVANAPKPLQVEDLQSVKLNDLVDLFVPITNPNPLYYAGISYVIESGDQVVYRGTDFVLPGEAKRVLILGLKAADLPGNIRFRIEETAWRRINTFGVKDWSSFRDARINFLVEGANFKSSKDSGLSESLDLSEVEFTITNNTSYNYYALPVQIFLKNFEQVVGLTTSKLDNFKSGEKRTIVINFAGLVSNVDKVEVVPNLDISRKDIYNKFEGATTPPQ
ncbi:MAG: hypothetical protein WCG01_04660 [bacterium]